MVGQTTLEMGDTQRQQLAVGVWGRVGGVTDWLNIGTDCYQTGKVEYFKMISTLNSHIKM